MNDQPTDTIAGSAAQREVADEGAARPPTHRIRTIIDIGAACLPAVLYLYFVRHYSVNLPFGDDWKKSPFVVNALNGEVGFGAMWKQYAEARLFIPNLIFVWVGLLDNFNLRVIIALSAVSFIASYGLLLVLFRTYLARPLTPLRMLSLGLIWFSLADTGNSLWAFQFAWYLVIFFLMLALFCLFRQPAPRPLFTACAIGAAVAGSLSMLQGFALWPVGLCCLLWAWRPTRAHVVAVGCWLAAAGLTLAVYMHGYDRSLACVRGQDCSVGNAAHHPGHYARFFASLPGYVVPTFGPFDRASYRFHLILGIALLAASVVVVVLSLRERTRSPRPPLPVALITFALLFDVTIALGRGAGRIAAAGQSRFTMANIVLVTGLAVYAWAHAPTLDALRARTWWRPTQKRIGAVAFGALALFVVGQVIFTTKTGVEEGRSWRRIQLTEARVLANRDRIPRAQVMCYLRVFVTNSGTKKASELSTTWSKYIHSIDEAELYVFAPNALRKFRAEGPPDIHGVCTLPSATQLVPVHGGG